MALQAILFGADLKREFLFLGSFQRVQHAGDDHVYWQNLVCAIDGVCAMDERYPHCGALWRRQGGENAHLRRAISRSGLRATEVAPEILTAL